MDSYLTGLCLLSRYLCWLYFRLLFFVSLRLSPSRVATVGECYFREQCLISVDIVPVYSDCVRFEVLTAICGKITVVRNAMSYYLLHRYQRFGGSATSVLHPEHEGSRFLRNVDT
jgi:hypothetical protein